MTDRQTDVFRTHHPISAVPDSLSFTHTRVHTHVFGIITAYINHLKPTGHVMHQQFNIQQLYALPTLYLCVLYLSKNKQRLLPLTA